MENYFSNGIMRRMRQYSKAVIDNFHSHDSERKRLADLLSADEITKTVYHRKIEELDRIISETRKNLTTSAQKDLIATMEAMRQIAKQQVIKAPTPEIASTLQILATLDVVSPTQLSLYAEQMQDCPIAMQRLQQIAANHNQRILTADPTQRLNDLDVLESRLAYYLGNFTGNVDTCPFGVRDLYRYFQPEEKYMNRKGTVDTKKVNEQFWNTFVSKTMSYDSFDNPNGSSAKPTSQYFFGSVTALSEFIANATENLTGSSVEDKITSILSDCPDRYGAAYRYFKATGEDIGLNDTDNMNEEGDPNVY